MRIAWTVHVRCVEAQLMRYLWGKIVSSRQPLYMRGDLNVHHLSFLPSVLVVMAITATAYQEVPLWVALIT
jgi:hypothetical protein